MSYIVVISSKFYRKLDTFKKWKESQYSGGPHYDEYLRINYPDYFNYIISISQDSHHSQLNLEFIKHDSKIGDFSRGRYRIFTFHSQAHYTWFMLKVS